ncbi:MAG: hypothetical protein D6694_09825 [Gammaproteobacteria bacterium]|nr:MAG: hypothetical protein D6694_09825 [Gammaproteobacteria bacterium]
MQQRIPTYDTLTLAGQTVLYRQEHRGLRRGVALVIDNLPDTYEHNWVRQGLTHKLNNKGWSVAILTRPSSLPTQWLGQLIEAVSKLDDRPVDIIWLQPSPNWLDKAIASLNARSHIVLFVKAAPTQVATDQRWVPKKPTLFVITMSPPVNDWLLRQMQLAETAGHPLSISFWPNITPEPAEDNLIVRRMSGWLARQFGQGSVKTFLSAPNR